MSAFLIRQGVVLASDADIDVLVAHAKGKTKVKEATVLSYTNGYATLHVTYSDGAAGKFDGVSVPELRDWADSNKGWPRCITHSVQARYPVLFDAPSQPEQQAQEEAAAEEATEAEHYATVRRTRTRAVKVVKRTRRTA